VYFPSDNSDLLSSHFCVQSEVHYFWSVSARIFVYELVQSKAIYFRVGEAWSASASVCVQTQIDQIGSSSQPLIIANSPEHVCQGRMRALDIDIKATMRVTLYAACRDPPEPPP
jgi:hypothetical protein